LIHIKVGGQAQWLSVLSKLFWRSGSRLLSKLWQALLNGHLSNRQDSKIHENQPENTWKYGPEMYGNYAKYGETKICENALKYVEIQGSTWKYGKLHFTRYVV